MRSAAAAAALLGGLFSTAPASALVPWDRVVLLVVPLDPAAAAGTAEALAGYARSRLGYRPEKVLVAPAGTSLETLPARLRDGDVQRVLQQDDLVVLWLEGATDRHAASIDRLAPSVPGLLRRRGSAGPGLFHGSAVVVVSHARPRAVPARAPADDVSVIDLVPRKGDPDVLDARRIAERPWQLARQGLTACGAACDEPFARGGLSPGAARVLMAWESLAAEPPDAPADAATVAALVASDGLGDAAWTPATSYVPSSHETLLRRMTVKLRALGRDGSRAVQAVRDAVQSRAPPETRRALRVLGAADNPGRVFVDCAVYSEEGYWSAACDDERGRRVYDAEAESESLVAERISALADQLLGRYAALSVHHRATLQAERRPAFVVFLADVSTSMAYNDPTSATDPDLRQGETKRAQAALRLLSALGAQALGLRRATRFALVAFSDEARVVRFRGQPTLTLERPPSDRELDAIRKTLDAALAFTGGTDLLAPLEEARRLVARHGRGHEVHVVLLTDGQDTEARVEPGRAGRILEEARELKRLGASLHTVGLTEEKGRLQDYLRRLAQGGEVCRRYRVLFGSEEGSCRYHADEIRKTGFHDPAFLDQLRLGDGQVKGGAFVQPDSSKSFERQFEEVVTLVAGGGVYAGQDAIRQADPYDPRAVTDHWRFDVDLRTEARIVLFNPDGLDVDRRRGWTVTRDGRPVPVGRDVRVQDLGRTVTEIVLRAPARGLWHIARTGRMP